MAKNLALKSFRLKNFKAIKDSGVVKFTPLTVLIGDNGSGKSSLIEGLETYQKIVVGGVDRALDKWRGFDYVVNPSREHKDVDGQASKISRQIEITLSGSIDSQAFKTSIQFGSTDVLRNVRIENERVYFGRNKILERDSTGSVQTFGTRNPTFAIPDKNSIIAPWIFVTDDETLVEQMPVRELLTLSRSILEWQFVKLVPGLMGDPQRWHGADGKVRLWEDGFNIAEFLLDIQRLDENAFYGILETMQFVLPQLQDLRPAISSEFERSVYILAKEGNLNIPGWMLSQGTLRILALLALFRHPEPPPVIIIEEIENGLDPRAIHLIVEEMRNVVESGRSQVIVTTHSPYLLDLLPLWSIVLVEREKDKGPVFFRPDEQPELDSWLERFGPGQLYTMQGLRLGASQ